MLTTREFHLNTAIGRFLHISSIRAGLLGLTEAVESLGRLQDERDHQRGRNKFAPRPAILSGQMIGAPNGSLSGTHIGASASPLASTVRMLEPEICQALRMLKLDIPELYLDSAAWNVSLAVIKVELCLAPPAKKPSRGKRR